MLSAELELLRDIVYDGVVCPDVAALPASGDNDGKGDMGEEGVFP